MRTRLVAPLLVLMTLTALASPTRASAQDFDDFAAYVALILTPTGGLVPLGPTAPTRGSAFVLRYGNLDSEGSALHNFAFGGDFAAGRGRLGLTLGGTTCDGCEGSVTAGLDYTVGLTRNVVAVALRPALGFSKPLEGDGTALSLGLSLPIGVELSGATGPIFIPYLVPGFGYGRISGDEDSDSGTRTMLGGGFSVTGRQGTFAVHLGFQKVFIEDGEMTFGLGMSIGRRVSSSTPGGR